MNLDDLRELAEAEEPRTSAQPGLGGVLRPGGDGVTEILLIRHAQMPATTDPRVDEPLTELGLRQADVLGRFVARRTVDAIYSSPTLRTRQTADAIARHSGVGVIDEDDLREIEVYVPEGMTWDELRNSPEYKEMGERLAKERTWNVYGKYRESSEALRARIARVVDEVVRRHKGERVALVTHGPCINSYVAVVAESPIDLISSSSLTGVTIVLAAEDRRRLLTVNNRAHFGAI